MSRNRFSTWSLQILLGWVNFAMTAPVIYLYLGLPLVMREHGWTGTAIGVFQLAGLPAVLKFVLAVPVDRGARGASRYRRWSCTLLTGYAACLMAMAWFGIENAKVVPLFALAMLASLLGTWADAPVNALAIRCLSESERMRAGIIRSAASSLGAVVGGGLMLMLHNRYGWTVPFQVLAGGVLSAALCIWLVSASHLEVSSEPPQVVAGVRQWGTYFCSQQRRLWVVTLMVYFPFIGTAWIYLKPLLLDHGLPMARVAMVAGVLGGVVGALGSALGYYMVRRRGIGRALPGCALLGIAVLIGLALAVATNASTPVLIACALCLALTMGAAAGLLFGMMMNFTREGLAAVDYGLQSSLFALTRTLVPMLAGVLLDQAGYLGMLCGLVLCMIVVWRWSTVFVRHLNSDVVAKAPEYNGRATGAG